MEDMTRNDSKNRGDEKQPDKVQETSAYNSGNGSYGKKPGEYTLEDYYALSDDRRVELIDGVIYDMAAPKDIHQIISARLWKQLDAYIEKEQGKCIPLCAPIDVQLDCDDKTMVQPDIIVVCDREKFKGVIYGAPDLVIEIISPSTRKTDAYLKLTKYKYAGVREYWLADTDRKKIIVYDLEGDEIPVIYGFEDKIPVGIFEGNCVIDFAKINEYIQFLYEV